MKHQFKKAQDYPGVAVVQKVSEALEPKPGPTIQVQEVAQWECVNAGCTDKAVVLHRGTSYCRKHYDSRAWSGELIN